MKKPAQLLLYIILSIVVWNIQCTQEMHSKHYGFEPSYSSISLLPTNDTLTIFPDSSTYVEGIKTFNYFKDQEREYLSFYDKQSQSVAIYQLSDQQLVNKIHLKTAFKGRQLFKTTVFCKSLDFILVNNGSNLYFINSEGHIKDSIKYTTKPYLALSSFDNSNPAVIQDDLIYAEARPRASYSKDVKKWKVLYRFDITNKKSEVLYHISDIYKRHVFSYSYFSPSYCYNDNHKFVFSFPADTNIYETDLEKYNNSYFGRSQYQHEIIQPIDYTKGMESAEIKKRELMNYSYGPIYFDSQTRRYLRVAKQKLTKDDYINKRWKKEQSLIIFDEKLKIIGESKIDRNISLSSVFITSSGNIYARTNTADDKAIHFVKLRYSIPEPTTELTKHISKHNK